MFYWEYNVANTRIIANSVCKYLPNFIFKKKMVSVFFIFKRKNVCLYVFMDFWSIGSQRQE